MELDMNEIGKRIKKRRKELHLTQTSIKESVGISSGQLSEVENGNRAPALVTLYRLSLALDCSTDWIITGKSPLQESVGVSEIEEQLLEDFRNITKYEQEELLEILNMKIRRKKELQNKDAKLSPSGEGDDFIKIG